MSEQIIDNGIKNVSRLSQKLTMILTMSAVSRMSEQIKYNGIKDVKSLSQQLKNDINTDCKLS
jgi:hypothetical protein